MDLEDTIDDPSVEVNLPPTPVVCGQARLKIQPPPTSSVTPVAPITMEENDDATDTIHHVDFGSGMVSIPITPTSCSEGFFINNDAEIPIKPSLAKRRASLAEIAKLQNDPSGSKSTGGPGKKRRSSVSIISGPQHDKIEEVEPHSKRGSIFGSRRFRSKRASSFALTPQRSLRRYLTRDVLPHMDHYRNRMSFAKGNS